MTQTLLRFRVIIKRGDHPTDSLTLRCFDILGENREEVFRLCGSRGRSGSKLCVLVRQVDEPTSELAYSNLMARRQRRLAKERACAT